MHLQELKAKVEAAYQKMLEEQTHAAMIKHWQAVTELDAAERYMQTDTVLRSEILNRRAEDRGEL